tara:strand:- start:220 stop:825 length:606 start_codon:yes stop_codon:yes gene_type:complete
MSGNVRKFNEPIMVPSMVDATGAALGGGGGGGESAGQPYVSADANSTLATEDWPIVKDTITVAGLVLSFTSGARAGTAEILTNPAGAAKMIIGASMALSITLDGNWVGTETLQFALGTVTNTNATLSGTEESILASDDVGVSGNGTLIGNSSDNINANQLTPKLELLAGGSIWLNGINTSTGVTGTVAVSGTIEIYYIDLD